ncbi:MAG TPA: methyltransferase domain-containing protein [Ktedonobacterales bacterium]|jgi:SAM-dependent methyltransferase
MAETIQDQWAQWLLQRRHGGDPEQQQTMLQRLFAVRDQVLQHADIAAGETMLDVGTGDGLIAFGGLPQVGEQGQVIFSDISQDLLDHSQALAGQMSVLDRCQFVRASADDLTPLADASVDVVTTRSVLIYVAAKQQAFHEFYRVLKPGGRISLFEPINRFAYPEPGNRFFGYNVTPVQGIADKVKAGYGLLIKNETEAYGPMMDFGEYDLFRFAEKAGFGEIHLHVQVDMKPMEPAKWDTFRQSAPNPLAPTLEEVLQAALTPAEAEQFANHLSPLVERGQGTTRMAVAYLWAIKGV